LFSTFASFDTNLAQLSIAELVGAALFLTACVAGTISICFPVDLPKSLLIRDIAFFLGALLIWAIIIGDGEIGLLESLMLIGYYFMYVAVIGYTSLSEQTPEYVIENRGSIYSYGNESLHDLPSGVPSETSVIQDPDFDVEYYQPDLHFTHSFPQRSNLKRDNHHWQRQSFIEPRHREPSSGDGNEDILTYALGAWEPKFDFEKEVEQSLHHIFPIVKGWKELPMYFKVYAVVQTPIVMLLNITVPVIHQHHLDVQLASYAILEEEPLIESELETTIEYPKLLLFIQLFLSPTVTILLLKCIYGLHSACCFCLDTPALDNYTHTWMHFFNNCIQVHEKNSSIHICRIFNDFWFPSSYCIYCCHFDRIG
jgi:Ca2+/Na+ antiporter